MEWTNGGLNRHMRASTIEKDLHLVSQFIIVDFCVVPLCGRMKGASIFPTNLIVSIREQEHRWPGDNKPASTLEDEATCSLGETCPKQRQLL